jgi:5-methylcytosine-specific restriction endonuclease McrA
MNHVEVFFAANGFPPYACCFCGKPVNTRDELHIHHHDGDKGNNEPENLDAAHNDCHLKHHSTGRQVSDETQLAEAA